MNVPSVELEDTVLDKIYNETNNDPALVEVKNLTITGWSEQHTETPQIVCTHRSRSEITIDNRFLLKRGYIVLNAI